MGGEDITPVDGGRLLVQDTATRPDAAPCGGGMPVIRTGDRMVEEWVQGCREWAKWLVGNGPLPGSRARAILAGTVGVLVVLLVGISLAFGGSGSGGGGATSSLTAESPPATVAPLPSTTTTTTASTTTTTTTTTEPSTTTTEPSTTTTTTAGSAAKTGTATALAAATRRLERDKALTDREDARRHEHSH